jgi:hypothetical protein
MEDEVISLTDYLHAIEVVLERLGRACPERTVTAVRGQAQLVLARVESARLRRGIGMVGIAECQRLIGQPLPARVMTWLADCNRRLFAGDYAPLADHVLTLCRALEGTLHRQSCPTHFRPTHRPRRGLATAAGTSRHRHRSSSRNLPVRRGSRGMDAPMVRIC